MRTGIRFATVNTVDGRMSWVLRNLDCPMSSPNLHVDLLNTLAMGHNLCLHFGVDEHPFATYFDVHQGYRVLTSHIMSCDRVPRAPSPMGSPGSSHPIGSAARSAAALRPRWAPAPRPPRCAGASGERPSQNPPVQNESRLVIAFVLDALHVSSLCQLICLLPVYDWSAPQMARLNLNRRNLHHLNPVSC